MSDAESPVQLVVVGASAGGIEALSTLVATLPAQFPAPIVIAQHLDPTRPSHLGAILARRAPLSVVTVEDHAPLHAGTIYVVPSNRHVAITDCSPTLAPMPPGGAASTCGSNGSMAWPSWWSRMTERHCR